MIVQSVSPGRTFWVRLDPHQDVLRGLRQAVAEVGIANGVILGGVGSLSAYHVHVVSSTELPPTNAFVRGEGPWDIVNVNGAILGGRVHAHITFTNETQTLGGHLEEGTTVLTFAIIAVQEMLDVDAAAWDTVGPLTSDRSA